MSKYIDFDKFIEEKNNDHITIKVLGKEYKVAKQVPAIIPVLMARQEDAANKNIQATLLMKAADIMFGKENVDEMCRKGLSSQDLVKLIERIFKSLNEADDDDSEELDDESSKKVVGGDPSKK